MNKLFSHIEYDSDHGIDLGIWPRFYLQMQSLAEFSGETFDATDLYRKEVIPEIKNLFDLNFLIQGLIEDYVKGIKDRKYFYVSDQGTPIIHRHYERDIVNKVEDFISRGKVLLLHFVDCGIISESHINISEFLKIKNQDIFEKKKSLYLSSTDKRHLPIINLIERARNSFLNEFKLQREEAQHHFFKLDKFKIQVFKDQIIVEEPIFEGLPLSKKISFIMKTYWIS